MPTEGHGSLRPVVPPRGLFAKPRARLDARRGVRVAATGTEPSRDVREMPGVKSPMDDPQTGLFSPQTRATAGAAPGAAAEPRQRLLVQHPPLVPAPLGCGWGRLLGTPRAAPIPAPPGLAPFPFWPWGKFNHRGKAPRIPPALHPSVPAGWQGGQRWLRKMPGGRRGPQPFTQLPTRDGSRVLAAGCWHPSAPRSLQQAVPQGHQAATTVRVGAELTHQVPKPQSPSPPATKAAQV